MRAPLVCASLLLLGGCDKPAGPSAAASASASTTEAPKAAPSATGPLKFAVVPDIHVDDIGISIGGRRPDLSVPTGASKLKELCEAIPHEDKQVKVVTTFKCKLTDVVALVHALGEAGVREVQLVMSGGRKDVPGEIVLVPETRVRDADKCTVVASVMDDLATGVWSFGMKGGARHTKGQAGPDLTRTGESIEKVLKRCDSKKAFFSANQKLRWEHAFYMGALIKKHDADKKIDTLVLLREEPVAGQPVKLSQ